jgi:hypothetical protein
MVDRANDAVRLYVLCRNAEELFKGIHLVTTYGK